MGLSIKVKDVKPLDDMKLFVLFENDVTKIYDVRQLIPEYPIYNELKNKSLFNLVHVDCGGYAIAWNEDIDIPEVELWEGGIELNG
jgi:Protein of unknown function (DUF2442).